MKMQQIAAIVIGTVTVGVLVGSAIILMSALSRTEEVSQRRDGKRADLERIYAERIFPTPDNVAVIKQESLELTTWKTNFVEKQRAVIAVETRLTPSQFMQVLQPTIRELAGGQAASGTRIVADGFAFGFDTYISGGAMPEGDDIPKLAIQLELTKRLCRELFAANIISLQAVQRYIFETAATQAEPSPAEAGAGRRGRTRAAATTAKGSAGEPDPRALSGLHPFTLQFTARKDAFLTVLNRLAASDLFIVVKEVEVKKVGQDVKGPNEKWRELGAAPHQQRVVSGPEWDPPLTARIALDIEIF